MDILRYVDPFARLKSALIRVKELYEPLWIDLHTRSKVNGFRIRGIWIADVAHQGASLALNEHLVGLDSEFSPALGKTELMRTIIQIRG